MNPVINHSARERYPLNSFHKNKGYNATFMNFLKNYLNNPKFCKTPLNCSFLITYMIIYKKNYQIKSPNLYFSGTSSKKKNVNYNQSPFVLCFSFGEREKRRKDNNIVIQK